MAFMAKRTFPKEWDFERAQERFQTFKRLVEEHEIIEDGFVLKDVDDGELMLTFERNEAGHILHRTVTILPSKGRGGAPTMKFLADRPFDADLIFKEFVSPEPDSVFFEHV